MTPRQVADISVARLALPVPAGKLVVMHALADALTAPKTAGVFEDALVDWISTRQLESECLEALSVFLIVQARAELLNRVRGAIGRPSIASDFLLSLASGVPPIVSAWTGCHSGKAPHHVNVRSSEELLAGGTFIPPVFQHALEHLEDMSGIPLSRQWAFEFDVLSGRVKNLADGHLSYFLGRERSNGGQFVATQGHLARSAYLRTLVCAVEQWGMPQPLAVEYACKALPADPLFLKLLPGRAPRWAQDLHQSFDDDSKLPELVVRDCLRLIEAEGQQRVLHLSAAVSDMAHRHVELTVFGITSSAGITDTKLGLGVHRWMPGRVSPMRDGLRAFICPSWQAKDDLDFTPTVLPLVGSNVGYLQSDYIGCLPYIPFSTPSMPQIELVPAAGRIPLMSQDVQVGEFNSWYWNWQPSHPNGWASPIACCSKLTAEAAKALESDLDASIHYVWEIVTWTRETDYGEWSRSKQSGGLTKE